MNDFNKQELDRFLDFIETCDMVKINQLPKLFTDFSVEKIEKMKRSLLKRKRIHLSKCGEYLHSTQIGTTNDPRPDKALTVALGVLGDLMPKVQYFHKAAPPAQIYFITHNGGVFEIIYVEYGNEALVSGMVKSMLNNDSEDVKRIIIIDDSGQIAKMKNRIPNIWRFALVKQGDAFEYINPEEVERDG